LIDLSINISPQDRSPAPPRMSLVRLAWTLVAVALLSATAAACKPSQLRYRSMPREQRVPLAVRPAVHAFFPWAKRSGENALRAGPVYLLALTYRSQISRDGDDSDGAGNDLHRALVAVAPSYPKQITLTRSRVGGPGPHTTLMFSTNGATHCKVSASTSAAADGSSTRHGRSGSRRAGAGESCERCSSSRGPAASASSRAAGACGR
jgi:hypothetical protein